MRAVALLAIRNEALYLERCLKHLIEQGIDVCIIDNDSTDYSPKIYESFFGMGVFRVEIFPYPGYLDWVGILKFKEQLAAEIDADWFIHYDADEIRQAPREYSSLFTAFEAIDRAGYNAADFAECLFFPTTPSDNHETSDYVETMRHYYYFQPTPLHRVNAWKKTGSVNLVGSAGHRADFIGRAICPMPFILRHYVALSARHAARKYTFDRVYSPEEVNGRGWHRQRSQWKGKRLELPSVSEMKVWDKHAPDLSDPKPHHLFSFV